MRFVLPLVLLLGGGCSTMNAVNDLAPGGTLRAAINVGNAVLAQRPATPGGEPTGISGG